MKNLMTYFTFVALLGACSMDVKKAHAPTAPPQIEKNAFSAQQLEGSYQQGGRPVMFTWPDENCDDQGKNCVPMTFAEKVDVRAAITRLSDDKARYESEFKVKEPQIKAKFKQLAIDLNTEYKETNKCYTLCDPTDFACEPDNPDNFPQYTWKEPESEEEKVLIERCQVVQEEIESLGDMETAEINAIKEPATKANNDLLATVGTNFFSELTEFGYKYGVMDECKDVLGVNEAQLCTIVEFTFEDVGGNAFLFSNNPASEPNFKIRNADMDRETGIMTFDLPLVDFSGTNVIVHGNIAFSLELNPGTGTMKVAGDIRVQDFFTGEETIGRFDSSGTLQPL